MTKFEEKLMQTRTPEEAMAVPACPEGGFTSNDLETLRLIFLAKTFDISICEYVKLREENAHNSIVS